MEKKSYCFPMLSLSDIALRRVIVNLWNEPDILSAIAKFLFGSRYYIIGRDAFREAVEEKVTDKLLKLALPSSLKKEMMSLLKPIGLEIGDWKRFHDKYLSDATEGLDVPILEKLHWTSQGTIDYRKTAEELIRCEMVNSVNRYKLASLYCLDDYIPSLWEELPEEIKSTFYNKDDTSHFQEPFLPFYWPYILKGEEIKLNNMIHGRIRNLNSITFHQYAFENMALTGNKAAAEYFYNKLSPEEREDSLVQTAHSIALTRNIEMYEDPNNPPMEKQSEVFWYLFSQMAPEQQLEILKKRPPLFFRCFLDWPLLDHFLEMVGRIWTFLSDHDYDVLLWNMFHSFLRAGYYIPKLFQEFFIDSPVEFKKHFISQSRHFGNFFTIFVNDEDSDTIKVILRNVDDGDRIDFITSYRFFNLVDDLMMHERWHNIELCLREATLSKEDTEKLKKTFMQYLNDDDKLLIQSNEWKRFFRLLDEIGAGTPVKSSPEDETQAKAKKRNLPCKIRCN